MPIKNPELTPWPLKESRSAGDYKIFKVRSDRRTSPRTSKEHEFFVIESVDWCNIIALTPDDQLVMVEQYRQGTNLIELELPGGMIDPGEVPLETAARDYDQDAYSVSAGFFLTVSPDSMVMAADAMAAEAQERLQAEREAHARVRRRRHLHPRAR